MPQVLMPLSQPATERSTDRPSPAVWHIITCEYPPTLGGVSDYTYLVAKGLASEGDEVHVWCPGTGDAAPVVPGVTLHAVAGFSILDLKNVGRSLDAFSGSRRILVQWVPHGFGYKAINLPFCWWLRRRAFQNGDDVDLMVHEPFLPFAAGKWRQNAVAAIQRLMTRVLLQSARRVWLSTATWEQSLRPYDRNRDRKYGCLPPPSTIPLVNDPAASRALREGYGSPAVLLGHFGTFGPPIAPMVRDVVPSLLGFKPDAALVCIGVGSVAFRDSLVRDFPEFDGRVFATGPQDAARLSLHLSACDVFLQPYPDGVTSRRTTVMAALAHARPIVTTAGAFTESIWEQSRAVTLAPVGDLKAFIESARRLMENPTEREALGKAGRALYDRNFDVRHLVAKLRGSVNQPEDRTDAR